MIKSKRKQESEYKTKKVKRIAMKAKLKRNIHRASKESDESK